MQTNEGKTIPAYEMRSAAPGPSDAGARAKEIDDTIVAKAQIDRDLNTNSSGSDTRFSDQGKRTM